MIDLPQIVSTDLRHTAVIRFTVPREEIQRVMGPAIGEVIGTVSAQGIGPAGPVFSYHFRMDSKVFDFEVSPAWGEFNEWVKAEGLTPAAGLWECYIAGPESGPDPSTWRTELNRPLAR